MSYRKLYHGQPGTSSAQVYVENNAYTTITACSVTNTTGGAVTLSMWFVPSGGSATDANKILDDKSIPANSEVGLDVPVVHTLDKGEAIHLEASAGTSLAVRISGDVSGD